jgi:tetratricopeptide (TPR) repeat protein
MGHDEAPPMRSSLRFVLALALGVPALVLASPVRADDAPSAKPAPPRASATRHDAAAGTPEFMAACADGNAKYVAKDIPGAILAYQKAIKLAPRNPLGHYLLGEAQLGAGNLEAAGTAWLEADQVGDSVPAVKAKILFVLADLREREKKWDDAKAAWQRYAEFAAKHPDVGVFPASAGGRIQAIDEMLKQDKAYDIVRQRIKEEKSGGAGQNKS